MAAARALASRQGGQALGASRVRTARPTKRAARDAVNHLQRAMRESEGEVGACCGPGMARVRRRSRGQSTGTTAPPSGARRVRGKREVK